MKNKLKRKGNRTRKLTLNGKAKTQARIAASKARKDQQNLQDSEINWRSVFNSAPNFIHEDDYKPMHCVICGTLMLSIHDTANPDPIAEKCYAKEALENNNPNRCCKDCDENVVIPARLSAFVGKEVTADEVKRSAREGTLSLDELMKSPNWDDKKVLATSGGVK